MNCCCSNRYTVGITLGSLLIVGSVIVFLIGIMMTLASEEAKDPQRRTYLQSEAFAVLIISAASAIISSLFIVAIVKRIHYLIVLWLLLIIYIFYITCPYIYMAFIGAAMGGASGIEFLILVVVSLTILVLQVGIFIFSLVLFFNIRRENIEKAERLQHHKFEKTLI